MRVRLAEARDLSRITEITVSNLKDDPTFDYQWQNRHLYPDDNVFFWHTHLKEMLYCPYTRFYVVELEEHDAPGLVDPLSEKHNQPAETSEKTPAVAAAATDVAAAAGAAPAPAPAPFHQQPHTIVSFGIWERMGNSRAAKKWAKEKNTWINKLDGANAFVERWLLARKGIFRRDGSELREEALCEASDAVRREHFDDAGIKDWWSMELVVTDRRFRRRGAASSLVAQGCDFADAEGIWAGVEASPMGEPVYRRMGFVKKGTKTVRVEGEDEELTFVVMKRPPPGEDSKSAS